MSEQNIRPLFEERLILQSAQGDISAIKSLFAKLNGEVYRYAYAITNDKEKAVRLTKAAFIDLFENAEYYRVGEDDPMQCLLGICHKLSEREEYSEKSGTVGKTIRSGRRSEERSKPYLTALMNHLNSTNRQIVVLYDVLNLTMEEIFVIMHIRHIRVKSRYGRSHQYIRVLTGTKNSVTDQEMAQQLAWEMIADTPVISDDFLDSEDTMGACDAGEKPSRYVRKWFRKGKVRNIGVTAAVLALVLQLSATVLTNSKDTWISLEADTGIAMSVNGLNRVKSAVAEDEEAKDVLENIEANSNQLVDMLSTVTSEEASSQSILSEGANMLVTVLEGKKSRTDEVCRQVLETAQESSGQNGSGSALLIQIIPDDSDVDNASEVAAGKEALAQSMEEALIDCRGAGLQNLSASDLVYLYYHRGLNLDNVELYGVPSESTFLAGKEVANQIFQNLNSDSTWVDVFLTVWDGQLVYRVTVLEGDLKNIYQVDAKNGEILSLKIAGENTETEILDEEEIPVPTEVQTPTSQGSPAADSSGSGQSGNIVEDIIREVLEPNSVNEKVTNIISDLTDGNLQIDLHIPA